MTSTREAFGLLLASLYGSHVESMQVRSSGTTVAEGMVWWSVDRQGGRHLLIPLPSTYAVEERVGESLTMRILDDAAAPLQGRYFDLACLDRRLNEVFASLCDDVLVRLAEQPNDAGTVVQSTLEEWRRLLAPSPPVSEEVARGLFGELVVLGRLAKRNPVVAMNAWTGPAGHIHDFSVKGRGDLEVKTSEKEALEVSISSLLQVDPSTASRLALIRLRVISTPQGRSIADLVEHLEALGCSRSGVIKRLALAGFRLGVDEDRHRFELVNDEIRAWLVGEDFPGIRASYLPATRLDAISGLRYVLSLVGAPGELEGNQLEGIFADMMSG